MSCPRSLGARPWRYPFRRRAGTAKGDGLERLSHHPTDAAHCSGRSGMPAAVEPDPRPGTRLAHPSVVSGSVVSDLASAWFQCDQTSVMCSCATGISAPNRRTCAGQRVTRPPARHSERDAFRAAARRRGVRSRFPYKAKAQLLTRR